MRYYQLGFALLLYACSKKDQPTPAPVPTGPVTQKEVNTWMLDSMRYFYLWNETLPTQADTATETVTYFNALKNNADPFSLLYNPGNWSTYPRYMLYNYGMDFSVIEWPDVLESAIGVVTLVIPGSNAANAGFKRGDYFTRINNTVVTAANAASLTAQILREGTASFTPAVISGNTVTEETARSISLGIATEDPIYAKTVIHQQNKQIAYLFYNAFKDSYNNQLIAAFQDFKNQGATELILDMRYNTGGSVAAAAMLTALIAPNVSGNSIFVQYTGNNKQSSRKLSFGAAMSYPEEGSPVAFSSIQPARLSLNRVLILTGPQTISAAELTINNLKPYTTVIQVGGTTYGKDKGAITIKDGRGRITWILQPITYRLANAKGEGNYDKGITPQYNVNEMNSLPLTAPGDPKDPLITKALAIIVGNARITTPETAVNIRTSYTTQKKVSDVILSH
jgi:C-terminal processing protease CtpA/Prc